jgi:chaperone BCS1
MGHPAPERALSAPRWLVTLDAIPIILTWQPVISGISTREAIQGATLTLSAHFAVIAYTDEVYSDGALHRLFLGLPRKCVVVIEDIDSAGIGREQAPSTQTMPPTAPVDPILDGILGMPFPAPQQSEASAQRRRNMVTLSGLLNAIDGNASQEGRLLIMTSNNPDALDSALTRPGRIDKRIYFGNMSASAGKSIFKRLIGRSALAHNAAFTMEQIEQWAIEFADKVPPNTCKSITF